MREREERARRKFLSSEEVKESSKVTFQQIWAVTFIGTHPKEKLYSRGRHENGGRGTTTRARFLRQVLGTIFMAIVLLKSVRSV